MMALFVWDLVQRQEDLLLQRRDDQAEALVMALASAAGAGIGDGDLAGMQELVDAQRRFPDLAYALLADDDGRILAHTERGRIGQFLLDLPDEPQHRVIVRASALLDIGTPVNLAGRVLGWARVGIGPGRTQSERAAIARSGLGYALAAIALGSVIAWVIAGPSTAGWSVSAPWPRTSGPGAGTSGPQLGADEIADLGRGINAMLDDLNAREAELAAARDALGLGPGGSEGDPTGVAPQRATGHHRHHGRRHRPRAEQPPDGRPGLRRFRQVQGQHRNPRGPRQGRAQPRPHPPGGSGAARVRPLPAPRPRVRWTWRPWWVRPWNWWGRN